MTNSAGAEDFRICEAPVDAPGSGELARDSSPHKPGRLILDIVAFKDISSRLEREDGLPRIVIRELRRRRRARRSPSTRRPIRSACRRLRIRHHDAALHLFVDDDAGAGLRLRHGDARRACCARRRKCPRGHDPARLCHAPRLWRRRRTARRCRSRCSTARTRRSTARRRCCSTATAPTASPSRPRFSHQRACRWSTAASSTPSPMSAAARTRAIAGTRTASATRRRTPSPTSSPPASYLVAEGYTARGRIVAQGGSAGGMLMGAVANMAPDLFAGIIAEVPFVDVLNTMLDDTLPLTPPEWPEWGNPIDSRGGLRDHRAPTRPTTMSRPRPIRRSWRSPA